MTAAAEVEPCSSSGSVVECLLIPRSGGISCSIRFFVCDFRELSRSGGRYFMFLVLFTYLESSSLMYLLRVKLNHGHGVKRRKLIMMEYDSSRFFFEYNKKLNSRLISNRYMCQILTIIKIIFCMILNYKHS